MNFQLFDENQWLYPDTAIDPAAPAPVLESARGTSVCLQLLTDVTVNAGTPITVDWTCDALPLQVLQLLPAVVDHNSHADRLVTDDYASVAHFVTRQAPFTVYDITAPIDGAGLAAGRAAFWLRIRLPIDAVPGSYTGTLTLSFGGESLALPLAVRVYSAVVPPVEQGVFHMVNWLNIKNMGWQHNVETASPAFDALLDAYLQNQLDMRNDYIMIPSGVPVRDENGAVVDFDFSMAEKVGNAALAAGFRQIMGGFVARFEIWDEPTHYLLWDWDKKISVAGLEGYRQLKIYFAKAYATAVKNGWLGRYMQCLVDEPQFPNSEHYRILSCICRRFMPGVPINDPTETTDIEGALDVWVVKQATYEQYYDTFRALQDMGEEMWIYTCGFPGGYVMNRVMDLPLIVSRLPMWMCYAYDCKGFLHWGYNVHNPEVEKATCYRADDNDPMIAYPAGNAHIIYPGKNGPVDSPRSHLQRAGAEDFELLAQLGAKDPAAAKAIVARVCKGFADYTNDISVFAAARHQLLEALEG